MVPKNALLLNGCVAHRQRMLTYKEYAAFFILRLALAQNFYFLEPPY